MKLGAWLKKNKRTQDWLAKKLKTDQGHVSRLVTFKVQPEFTTMVKVDTITRGDVTFADWKKEGTK